MNPVENQRPKYSPAEPVNSTSSKRRNRGDEDALDDELEDGDEGFALPPGPVPPIFANGSRSEGKTN